MSVISFPDEIETLVTTINIFEMDKQDIEKEVDKLQGYADKSSDIDITLKEAELTFLKAFKIFHHVSKLNK